MTGTEEFDDFAASAWPRLHRAAYLLTGDHHLAEDLAQATLVRTYASWRRVRRADAQAYARRVLVNLNIDRVRRKRPVEVGDAAVEHLHTPLDRGTSPPHAAEQHDEVVRLLRTLTERERRVVVLRHYFDLSEAETARELGVAPGTVKSTLARGLAKLRVVGAPDEPPGRAPAAGPTDPARPGARA